MSPLAILLLLLMVSSPALAEEISVFPDLNLQDPASLQEAARVLEEEVKLASRPQPYLLIDLVTRTIHIKGRGVDLHRIPIVAWSLKGAEIITGTHRLITRPSITRRKIDPNASVEQPPISLTDMPADYALSCIPPLTINVLSSSGNNPLRWIQARGTFWWRKLKEWSAGLSTTEPLLPQPALDLELSSEQAQSLAWAVVDHMPLVIRRSADKKT